MNLLWVMLMAACSANAEAAPGSTLPPPERLTFNCSADGSRWPYLVQRPSGEPKAVLINLHGHYSDEYQGMTEGIYNDALGKLRRECLQRGWVYVCAWYGGNSWMGPLGEQGMVDLITLLRRTWPGRPVYLGGGSMGGSSTLVFCVRRPDLIDGAMVRCPAADIESYYAFAASGKSDVLRNIAAAIRIHYTTDGHVLADELRSRSALLNAEKLRMPLHIVHGARDALIPVGATRALVEKLRALGRRVEYVELPEGDHDSPVTQLDWTATLDFISQAAPPQ